MLFRKNIAEFNKIDFKEFIASINYLDLEFKSMTMQQLIYSYNSINIPYRLNDKEAAYNIETPFNFTLTPMESIIIPTGISCSVKLGWILHILKANTLTEVDSEILDTSVNGEQILVRITNMSDEILTYSRNDILCKGIFIPYGTIKNENIKKAREYYYFDDERKDRDE